MNLVSSLSSPSPLSLFSRQPPRMSKRRHSNRNNTRVPFLLLLLVVVPFVTMDNDGRSGVAHALQVPTTTRTTINMMGFAKQRNIDHPRRLSSSSSATSAVNHQKDEIQINNHHKNDVTQQQQQQQQQPPQQVNQNFSSNDTPVTSSLSSSFCHPTRRQTCAAIVTALSFGRMERPCVCQARNLPESTGTINTSKVGTVETLIPIVQIDALLQKLESQLGTASQEQLFPQFLSQFAVPPSSKGGSSIPKSTSSILQLQNLPAPTEEMAFKQIFDAYSIPPSYKQKFLNSNAFLVYYTQGYDGPNRPSIEQNNQLEELQIAQYGYRNEAWIAYEEMMSELQYSLLGKGEEPIEELIHNIQDPLHRTIQAIDAYIRLVPSPESVQQAKAQIVLK